MNSKAFCQLSGIKLFLSIAFFFCLSFSVTAENKNVDDSDGDGLSDLYEESIGTEIYLADTDGDGIDDGIEVGKNKKKPLNSDGDRYIDALDYDDDNDGLPTILESKADTDKDGLKDYLDTDSDNDKISDGVEAGMFNKDDNFDLIDDAFDSQKVGAIDKNGDGVNDNVKLPDHDNDGIPDYLDRKYSGKVIAKKTVKEKAPSKTSKKIAVKKPSKKEVSTKKIALEKKKITPPKAVKKESIEKKIVSIKAKPKEIENKVTSKNTKLTKTTKEAGIEKQKPTKKVAKKTTINRYTDTDNDGLLDSLERKLGTNPLRRDSDGDKVSDAIEIGMDINNPQDSDHDKIIDALDPDDDNDGILTKNEDVNKDSSPINDDTDDDGVPNYLDANDDGDRRLTREEGSTRDTDKDGILDYLDKNDGVKDTNRFMSRKQSTPENSEVVVLFDGNLESLENDLTKETIENASLNKAEEQENASKKKEKKGFITWITSLLPD